jgi:hypothetical protein
MYMRFVSVKSTLLLNDYVLALHRLGVDDPAFLPEPPRLSVYHRAWDESRRQLGVESHRGDVYMEKFRSFYGHQRGDSGSRATTIAPLFPVALASAVLAAGWASILLGPAFFDETFGGTADVLRYSFLGAYSFVIQMVLRRYFQNDLRPGTYLSIVTRVIVVASLALVIHAAWPTATGERAEMAVAFIVGFFPLVGMQWLQKVVAARLRRAVPSLQSNYPLADLDGLNIWYEARLLEEGIEDMQNLVTANLVDVILHTTVPVGRLVDWVDQASLLLHLPHEAHDEDRRGRRNRPRRKPVDKPASHRQLLRQLGIRSATDLEDALAPRAAALTGRRRNRAPIDDEQLRASLCQALTVSGVSVAPCVLKTFENEPNLDLVRNWKADWRPDAGNAAGNSDGTSDGTAEGSGPRPLVRRHDHV